MMINNAGNRSLSLVALCLSSLFSATLLAAEANSYFSSASYLEIDTDKSLQADDYSFEGQWLYGSDYNKIAILTEGQITGSTTEDAEIQLLYSKYLATFWDLRLGLRQTFKPKSETSLVIGVEGLAPYWFDVGSSLYMSEKGDVSADVELAYEIQLTQKLVMQLYTNANVNAYSDQKYNIGSGLSEADYGVQIRYEFNRHIAVYFDINEARSYGNTKDYVKAGGENYRDGSFRLGVKLFNF